MERYDLKEMRCAFCDRTEDQVDRLFAGSEAFICNECVELYYELNEEDQDSFEMEWYCSASIPKPREIFDILNEYVIGQEDAKRALAVAVYNHYKRISCKDGKDDGVELQKSNIVMLGPTGCGKTMLAETLARILDVPFAVADATSLTEAGYVGEDVESILFKLIQAADFDIAKAEKGIIYIDEIDKIARKGGNMTSDRDATGEGVQQALLKIIEGSIVSISPQGSRKHSYLDQLRINTKNILFICGGAFVGIEKIIEKRICQKQMGFGADVQSNVEKDIGTTLKSILPEDLLKFGLIPEFVGRVPLIVTLENLNEEALVRILTEPKNALVRQYMRLFEMDDVDLQFDEDAIRAVAREALARKTGARGLRAILEDSMLGVMFDIPSQGNVASCRITEKVIYKEEAAILTRKENASLEERFSELMFGSL